jgi:AcrR family transcriptional regulator
MATARAPRRLSRDARLEQLVEAAMPILGEHGLTDFSLDEVAARADVTRNLLYHYFPRGRTDLALAVVERAGEQLTGDWVLDDALPLDQRLSANFARIIEHALAPTDAWRIHRRARAAIDPEFTAVVARFVDRVISSISQNHLGTPDPAPLARIALTGYVAFAETVLDEARTGRAPREQVVQLLADTLVATVQAAA